MRTRIASANTATMEAITTMRMKVSLVSMGHSMRRTVHMNHDHAHGLECAAETAQIMAIEIAAL
jgi:hypothetical protein